MPPTGVTIATLVRRFHTTIGGKVFDPFFTTREVGSGSGQGLAISHATIVSQHQGTLTFESAEGGGTTFVIRLPLDGGAEVGQAA